MENKLKNVSRKNECENVVVFFRFIIYFQFRFDDWLFGLAKTMAEQIGFSKIVIESLVYQNFSYTVG